MRCRRLTAGGAPGNRYGAAGTLGPSDVERGEVVFKKCYACHSVVPGETGSPDRIGSAWSAAPGERSGFRLSEALETLPAQGYGRWTEATLDTLLAPPGYFASGRRDDFRRLADPEERTAVIAYPARPRAGAGEE
jgi:cytochrome c